MAESGGRFAAQVHQGKAGGVEELVGKVAGGLHRGGGVAVAVVVKADVLPGAGHLLNIEQPDAFNAVLLPFLLQR